MRAQLISDLHTEFHQRPLEFLGGIEFEPDLDFLLVPGDTVVFGTQAPETCRDVLEYLSTKARHVLFTLGNHEYYGWIRRNEGRLERFALTGAETEETLAAVLPSNFVWLNNTDVTLDGVHFYGGAMWFPDDPLNSIYESQLSDFLLIPDIRKWVYQSNTEFRENGYKNITPDTIVLTHHLPSPKSTPKMYADSTINRFFVSDEEALIADLQPRLWVHGHTHHSCDYKLGKTRVVCNPHGYPYERQAMKKKYTPVVLDI